MIEINDQNEEYLTKENHEYFKYLKTLGAKTINILYVGGGDQGEINYVNCKELEELNNSIVEELTDLGYQLLDSLFPGWEINEGSEGSITLDLSNEQPKITIDHGTYNISYDSYKITFSSHV